jgi:hypothetical protein
MSYALSSLICCGVRVLSPTSLCGMTGNSCAGSHPSYGLTSRDATENSVLFFWTEAAWEFPRFEVFVAMTAKLTVFWDTTPRSGWTFIEVSRQHTASILRVGSYCEDCTFLQNVGKYLPDYSVSHHRIQEFSRLKASYLSKFFYDKKFKDPILNDANVAANPEVCKVLVKLTSVVLRLWCSK